MRVERDMWDLLSESLQGGDQGTSTHLYTPLRKRDYKNKVSMHPTRFECSTASYPYLVGVPGVALVCATPKVVAVLA